MFIDTLPPEIASTTAKTRVISAVHNQAGIKEEHIGIIVGTLIALIIIIAVILCFIYLRNRKNRKYRNRTCLQAQNSTFEDLRSGTLKSSKSSNGNLYNFVATSDVDSDRGLTTCCTNNANTSSVYGDMNDGSVHPRKYPEFPRTPDSTFSSSNNRDYAVPDIMQSAVVTNGVNSSFVYSPSGVGTISGVICSVAMPNTYTNSNIAGPSETGGGNINQQPPPRLPVPPPPSYPAVAVPYASSDLVTLQAPKAYNSRAATPVNGSNMSTTTTNINHVHHHPSSSSQTSACSRNTPPADFLHHQGATLPASSSGDLGQRGNPFKMTPSNSMIHTLPRNSLQGTTGTNTFSTGSADSDEQWAEELAVMEFPRESLKYLDKLGEGQFGEVREWY